MRTVTFTASPVPANVVATAGERQVNVMFTPSIIAPTPAQLVYKIGTGGTIVTLPADQITYSTDENGCFSIPNLTPGNGVVVYLAYVVDGVRGPWAQSNRVVVEGPPRPPIVSISFRNPDGRPNTVQANISLRSGGDNGKAVTKFYVSRDVLGEDIIATIVASGNPTIFSIPRVNAGVPAVTAYFFSENIYGRSSVTAKQFGPTPVAAPMITRASAIWLHTEDGIQVNVNDSDVLTGGTRFYNRYVYRTSSTGRFRNLPVDKIIRRSSNNMPVNPQGSYNIVIAPKYNNAKIGRFYAVPLYAKDSIIEVIVDPLVPANPFPNFLVAEAVVTTTTTP